MPDINVHCDSCQHDFQVAEKFAGHTIKCPRCKSRLKVPIISETSAVEQESSAPGQEPPAPGQEPPAPPSMTLGNLLVGFKSLLKAPIYPVASAVEQESSASPSLTVEELLADLAESNNRIERYMDSVAWYLSSTFAIIVVVISVHFLRWLYVVVSSEAAINVRVM